MFSSLLYRFSASLAFSLMMGIWSFPAFSHPSQTTYTCSMHPKVHQTKPGKCPICHMNLIPVVQKSTTPIKYTCSMHPKVHLAKPGKCPICHMELIPATPTSKTRTSKARTSKAQAKYTCSMHPKVRLSEPGKCPICHMDLIPATPTSKAQAKYTCSMHPKVRLSKPGKCPICHMDLIPYRKPPPQVQRFSAIRKQYWSTNSRGIRTFRGKSLHAYIEALVKVGWKARGTMDQIEATSAMLQHYRGKEFRQKVTEVVNARPKTLLEANHHYLRVSLAFTYIYQKKRHDLLPLVERFLTNHRKGTVLEVKKNNIIYAYLTAASCFMHLGKRKQGLQLYKQLLATPAFANIQMTLLSDLLFIQSKDTDQLIRNHLKKMKANGSLLKRKAALLRICLLAREGHKKAQKKLITYALTENKIALRFLKKIMPRQAQTVYRTLFTRQKGVSSSWQFGFRFWNKFEYADNLAREGDQAALQWLRNTLRTQKNRHTLRGMVSILHTKSVKQPLIHKTLRQLLQGKTSDFSIACALFRAH